MESKETVDVIVPGEFSIVTMQISKHHPYLCLEGVGETIGRAIYELIRLEALARTYEEGTCETNAF